MSQDRVDLQPGSVLHIKRYTSRRHPEKDKYVLIIGKASDSEVLGFLISSQLGYLDQASHKREVVRIPDRATAFLRYESIIQCFELEHLPIGNLCEGFEQGDVTNQGRLPLRYLHKVRRQFTARAFWNRMRSTLALSVLPGGQS
jgi:hypothetical protein